MTSQDREEFESYLRSLTDNQVQGVLDKECEAGRKDYANLAKQELARRNLHER